MIFLIKFYQKAISPYLGHGKCKYYPTCSQYALEAFRKKPFLKALELTIRLILRFKPFSKGGYDPQK